MKIEWYGLTERPAVICAKPVVTRPKTKSNLTLTADIKLIFTVPPGADDLTCAPSLKKRNDRKNNKKDQKLMQQSRIYRLLNSTHSYQTWRFR